MNIKNLYREVILDHANNSRNKLVDQNVDGYIKKRGYNPSCGDDIVIFVKYDNNKITDIIQHSQGCSICTASTSISTVEIKGLDFELALYKIDEFLKLIRGEKYDDNILKGEFSGIKAFPARVKCASLSWITLKDIILDIKKGVINE